MLHRRLFLGACAAVVAFPELARAAGSGPVVIPFIRTNSRAIMLIGINGKGPYRFIIDTGNAGSMAINEDLARELQLPTTNFTTARGVVGHAERDMYAATEVNLGGVLRQQHVGFMELKEFGEGTRGLVAAQLFLSTPCEIDFEKQEVRLWLQGAPDKTGFVSLPMRPPSTNEIILDCMLDDTPIRLKLDTGAPGTILLNADYVARRNLWNAYPKFRATFSNGITGGAPARLVKGSSLKVGPYTFRDPLVKMTDPGAKDFLGRGGENLHDGLFGLDLLRRFTLSIDGPRHTLWLKANNAISDAYRMDRSGLNLGFDTQQNQAVVVGVHADTPAASAGLRKGDRIESVHSLKELQALEWSLSGFPGDVVDLAVAHPEGPQKVALTLVDPV